MAVLKDTTSPSITVISLVEIVRKLSHLSGVKIYREDVYSGILPLGLRMYIWDLLELATTMMRCSY